MVTNREIVLTLLKSLEDSPLETYLLYKREEEGPQLIIRNPLLEENIKVYIYFIRKKDEAKDFIKNILKRELFKNKDVKSLFLFVMDDYIIPLKGTYRNLYVYLIKDDLIDNLISNAIFITENSLKKLREIILT